MLVTRPEGQGQVLADAIAAVGCRPVLCPLIDIEALQSPDDGQREILLHLSDYQHLVFISSNAVICGMRWIAEYWPKLPAGAHWYTIGQGSAAALSAFGVKVERPQSEMSSEGLLALPALQEISGQRVLIVKGEGGRDLLRQNLCDRGARVQELATYRRCCPRLPEGELAARIRDQDCRVLLISSGEGLHNMVSLLGEQELAWVREISLVAPGHRVAAAARELGFTDVHVAANATDEAMLSALVAHLETGG